jgi:hypothetical protein
LLLLCLILIVSPINHSEIIFSLFPSSGRKYFTTTDMPMKVQTKHGGVAWNWKELEGQYYVPAALTPRNNWYPLNRRVDGPRAGRT